MRPSPRHRAQYESRLHRALTYLDQHIGEPVDLARLAAVAHFSAFHFHRLFAAHVGETFGSYLTRRRVETAALRLAAQPQLKIIAVSLDVGFGSPEAFARAFRRRFGVTPSLWRKSKLGQVKSSLGQDRVAGKAYSRSMNPSLLVTLKTRTPVRIAYLRYQGPFGEPISRFWGEKAFPWMAANGLVGAPRYGISHDDPTITARGRCRYDAGVEVGEDFVPSQGVHVTTVPGGRYACAAFRGRATAIGESWDRILREWLPASGYQLDSRSCFEYYPPDAEYDEGTGAFSCELCIPIARLDGLAL
jgi:AraC family transcriptional regulator